MSVTSHIDNLTVVISTTLLIVTNLIISSLIICFLFNVNSKILVFSGSLYGLAYFYISKTSKRTIINIGKEIVKNESRLINQVQETIEQKKR